MVAKTLFLGGTGKESKQKDKELAFPPFCFAPSTRFVGLS